MNRVPLLRVPLLASNVSAAIAATARRPEDRRVPMDASSADTRSTVGSPHCLHYGAMDDVSACLAV